MKKLSKIEILCHGERAVAVLDNNHYRCLKCGAAVFKTKE